MVIPESVELQPGLGIGPSPGKEMLVADRGALGAGDAEIGVEVGDLPVGGVGVPLDHAAVVVERGGDVEQRVVQVEVLVARGVVRAGKGIDVMRMPNVLLLSRARLGGPLLKALPLLVVSRKNAGWPGILKSGSKRRAQNGFLSLVIRRLC